MITIDRGGGHIVRVVVTPPLLASEEGGDRTGDPIGTAGGASLTLEGALEVLGEGEHSLSDVAQEGVGLVEVIEVGQAIEQGGGEPLSVVLELLG